jgi:hypothetical protein
VSRGRSGLLILGAAGAALAAVVGYLLVGGSPRSPATVTGEASARPPAQASGKAPAPGSRTATSSSGGGPSAAAGPAETGRLRIVADVPGAAVFFDHNYVGRAPVEVRNVVPGSHRLNVSAEDREVYAETLEVGPGPRTVIVRLQPIRLDESVDVVHRHGIGSCEGRLSATRAGLRYETGDKDDAFVRPFADLEPLEIDYPKKNLRVKVRKGKTYNFTTKAPKADDLAAFQQKVEAVRSRL